MKKPRPPVKRPAPTGPHVLPVPADIDRARVERTAATATRQRRKAWAKPGAAPWVGPYRTPAEVAAAAAREARRPCRVPGCPAQASGTAGKCPGHTKAGVDSLTERVGPPTPGRCNAVVRDIGGRRGFARCLSRVRDDQERCAYHPGMSDQPPPE